MWVPTGLGDTFTPTGDQFIDSFLANAMKQNAAAQQAQLERERAVATSIYETAMNNWRLNGSPGNPPTPPNMNDDPINSAIKGSQQSGIYNPTWNPAQQNNTNTSVGGGVEDILDKFGIPDTIFGINSLYVIGAGVAGVLLLGGRR